LSRKLQPSKQAESIHKGISRQKVFVIFGGDTSERQVSLMSGTNVWLNLQGFDDVRSLAFKYLFYACFLCIVFAKILPVFNLQFATITLKPYVIPHFQLDLVPVYICFIVMYHCSRFIFSSLAFSLT
jgi:hypothetical protein